LDGYPVDIHIDIGINYDILIVIHFKLITDPMAYDNHNDYDKLSLRIHYFLSTNTSINSN